MNSTSPLVPVKMLRTGEMDGIIYLKGIEYPLDEATARRLMRTVPSFRNED